MQQTALGLRGGALGKIKITNKSKAKDVKDIKNIKDLPDEKMGRTNPPPQIPKLRYRGGTTCRKMSVEDMRNLLELEERRIFQSMSMI